METTMEIKTELERKSLRLKQDINYAFKTDLNSDKTKLNTTVKFHQKQIYQASINTNVELTPIHMDRIQVLVGLHGFNDYRIKRSGDGLRILLTK